MKIKKSWKEKLNKKDLPKIVKLKEKLKTRFKADEMVIPSPREIQEIMNKIPKGKLITVNKIREILSKKHGVRVCCPMTTGIFIWIIANTAEEEKQKGKKNITPYWRTLKTGGFLNEKYPGGIENHKKLLEKEGFEIVKKGKKYMVKEFEKYIAKEIIL
jgi:alkylated DNA nucleotide flippase Atl1